MSGWRRWRGEGEVEMVKYLVEEEEKMEECVEEEKVGGGGGGEAGGGEGDGDGEYLSGKVFFLLVKPSHRISPSSFIISSLPPSLLPSAERDRGRGRGLEANASCSLP